MQDFDMYPVVMDVTSSITSEKSDKPFCKNGKRTLPPILITEYEIFSLCIGTELHPLLNLIQEGQQQWTELLYSWIIFQSSGG
jgi:hypothetical protein